MDAWGWEELQPWLDLRRELPVGPLLCVINGTTRGRHWSPAAARAELRRTAAAAGVRRRFAPHQLRPAHAVEMAREGVPLIVIQRQLGHTNLVISSIYLGASTARRSSTPSTPAAPRCCPSAARCASDRRKTGGGEAGSPLPVLVQLSSERTLERVRQDSSFGEKQQPQRARLLVVGSGRPGAAKRRRSLSRKSAPCAKRRTGCECRCAGVGVGVERSRREAARLPSGGRIHA